MNKNNNMITSVDDQLDRECGAPGTPQRAKFEDDAYAFFAGQILLDARKEAKMTQAELAKELGIAKSYISRIENGTVNPSIGTFYRIINALGMRIEIVKTIATL